MNPLLAEGFEQSDRKAGMPVLPMLSDRSSGLGASANAPRVKEDRTRFPFFHFRSKGLTGWTRRVFHIADWNPRQGIAFVAVQQKKHGAGMSRENAANYRLHAADSAELAQRISDPKGRLSLLEMSRMWLRLAALAEAEQSAAALGESEPR
jgi:hypothetical protein